MKKQARKSRKSRKRSKPSSLKKQYIKSGLVCRVTFRLSKKAAEGAKVVSLVGDFNNWSIEATPMAALKNGEFSVTLDLESGRDYRFRYLINGEIWENDWNADKYEANIFGSDDSVVVV